MNMREGQIARALAECADLLTGGFVEKIVQPADDTFIFAVRGRGKKFVVLLSGSPVNGRIHLLSEFPAEKGEFTPFGRIVKQLLTRGYLSAVTRPGADRIVELTVETHDGRRRFVAELMGTRGDIYLLDAEGKVMARAFGRALSIAPGEPYAPPTASPHSHPTPEDEPVEGGGKLAYNRALEKRYLPLAEAERLDRLKRAAVAPLRKELKRLERKRRDLAEERERLMASALDKRTGELLQANFHRLEKGAAAVTVENLFDEGRPITIPLDPAQSPQENVARCFKRYRRYEKGLPRLDGERAATDGQIARLTASLAAIEKATAVRELLPYLPATVREEAPAPPPKKKGPARSEAKTAVGRRFVSSEGYDIFVGRDDRENDELSIKVANGRDIWLHARDYPGSHVVVRLPKQMAEVPQKALREGAMLAIRYSKLAKGGQGEVTWCYAKDVRKPKGFAPGKVLVSAAKSIKITVDDAAVEAMRRRAEG
ncbi:MAG: NFACT family protein [Nitrospinae bacterium]|nr:NFACT family protein [Nitrospinota bacterium]